MYPHEEYLDLISAAVDGVLTEEESSRLKDHLADCPDCRALLADLQAIHTQFADLPPVAVPEGLADRINQAVAADNVTPLAPKKKPARWKRWASAAAMLALVLFGAGQAGLFPLGGNGPTRGGDSLAATEAATDGQEAADRQAVNAAPRSAEDAAPENEVSSPYMLPTGESSDVLEKSTDLISTQSDGISPAAAGSGGGVPEALQPAAVDGSSTAAALSPVEALDILLSFQPMPEEAQRVDSEGFLGWQIPYIPVDSGEPDGQQVSTQLQYCGLSENGKYHQFWLYSAILDDPATGLAHNSTLNYFAVSLDGGEILTERIDIQDPDDQAAYQAGIEAYHRALSE